jgi:hypothetical protein
LSASPALVASCVVSGLLEALTPLSIISGAIALFQAMQHTGCLAWLMGEPAARLLVLGVALERVSGGAARGSGCLGSCADVWRCGGGVHGLPPGRVMAAS